MKSKHTKSLLEELNSSGILKLEGFVGKSFIEELNNIVFDCLKRSYKKIPGSLAGHLNFSFGPEITHSVEENIIRHFKPLAKEYLSSKNLKIFIGGNVNLPGSCNQHWHMDSDFNDNFLVLNVLLKDFTRYNGSTEYIVNSHNEYSSYLDFLIKRIKGVFNITSLVGCTKGTVIIRDSNLWHRGTKNCTKSVRPMLSIIFYRSNEDIVLSPSEKGLRANWFSSNKKAIEFIYVYLRFLINFNRIRRSLSSEKKFKKSI